MMEIHRSHVPYGATMTWKDQYQNPMDLTGLDISLLIKTEQTPNEADAMVIIPCNISDAVNGIFDIVVSNTDIQNIPDGDYPYSINMKSGETLIRYFCGMVCISA